MTFLSQHQIFLTSLVLERPLTGRVHSFLFFFFGSYLLCAIFVFFLIQVFHGDLTPCYSDFVRLTKLSKRVDLLSLQMASYVSPRKVSCSEDRSTCGINPQPCGSVLDSVTAKGRWRTSHWYQNVRCGTHLGNSQGFLPTVGLLYPRYTVFGSFTHSQEWQTQRISTRALRPLSVPLLQQLRL